MKKAGTLSSFFICQALSRIRLQMKVLSTESFIRGRGWHSLREKENVFQRDGRMHI